MTTPRLTVRPRILRAAAILGGIALVGFGLVGAPLSAAAATLNVTSTADSGPGSLRATLASATPGDTIGFNLPDNSTISLDSTIIVPLGIVIDGSASANLTITPANNTGYPLLVFAPTSANQNYEVSNLTIDGTGGGIGGAIIATSGTSSPHNVTLSAVTIKNMNAVNGAALVADHLTGAVTVLSSSFTGNTASSNGGAIAADTPAGDVTLTGDYFEGNSASAGGAVWVSGAGSVTLGNTEFDGNNATTDEGGALFVTDVAGAVQFKSGCGVRGNYAHLNGGGVFLSSDDGGLSVDGTLFDGNSNGVRDVGSSTFVEGDGAGLSVADASGPISITGTTFSNNNAVEGLGGGLYVGGVAAAGSVSVDTSTFEDNTEFFGGGGMEVDGINTASGPGLDVEDSTFTGNSSNKSGSLAASIGVTGTSAPVKLVNSTLDEEASTGDLAAFGVLDVASQSAGEVMATLQSDTIDGPSAVAFANFTGGLVHVDNTILQRTDASAPAILTQSIAPGTISLDHDLIATAKVAGQVDQGGNRFSVTSFGLGALANNGGPTQTRMPAVTSPAHNAGNNADAPASGFDQRGAGFVRVVQTIDIGAVEFQTATTDPTSPSLPVTGVSVSWELPLGASAAVLAGGALVLLRRRRKVVGHRL